MKLFKFIAIALVAGIAIGQINADYTCVITKGATRAPAMAVQDAEGEYVYVHKKGGVYSDDKGNTYRADEVSPVTYERTGSPSMNIFTDNHCRCANKDIQNTEIGRFCKKMGNSNQAEGALLSGLNKLRAMRKRVTKGKVSAKNEAAETSELDELTSEQADAGYEDTY